VVRSSMVSLLPSAPPEIEDRAMPGHWEGDLIAGFADSYIEALVERQSRFTLPVKVNGKDTHTVVTALSKQVRKLPRPSFANH